MLAGSLQPCAKQYCCAIITICMKLQCLSVLFFTFIHVVTCCTRFLIPVKMVNQRLILSSDTKAIIHDVDELTDLQLKHHRVLKRLFAEYGITAPITKTLCDVLRCKLW